MNEKYEPIKFNSWQELAKYVIDGGEVYYVKKQPTLKELIAIKPRLCWVCYKNKKFTRLIVNVEHGFFVDDNGCMYDNAQMLTDDEIKQFLSGEQ